MVDEKPPSRFRLAIRVQGGSIGSVMELYKPAICGIAVTAAVYFMGYVIFSDPKKRPKLLRTPIFSKSENEDIKPPSRFRLAIRVRGGRVGA